MTESAHVCSLGLSCRVSRWCAPLNGTRTPAFKTIGAVLLACVAALLGILYGQFRGDFGAYTRLTLVAARTGLVMDPGARVTYNGVQIGRVAKIESLEQGEVPKAELTLNVESRYIPLIPANVDTNITAGTLFGGKYVSFTSPKHPAPARISSDDVIDVSTVTTETNTLFEMVVSIAEKVDPVKLNATLTATAQAFEGLGDRFGQSITNGDNILADLNQQMPQIREDTQKLADVADVYVDTSPDLWDAMQNAVVAAHTVNVQQRNLDSALMASIGLGNTGAAIFDRGGPYLLRGQADSIPTSQLFDEYSPALFCTIRKYHDLAPKVAEASGANGYSLVGTGGILGAGNPYIYPDNLPRTNARGGPEGRPGCWQDLTRDLWPAPYLVMDTGASIAPYNHIGLGQPLLIDYVWGRQAGEYTINP